MTSLLVESWAWFSVVTLINILRFIGRLSKEARVPLVNGTVRFDVLRGLKGLKIEDYLMVLAWSFYTADIVTINIASNQQSNLLPPGYLQSHVISPQERSARHFGSIITMVVEQCQISTIWLVKLCVLIMWHKLTTMIHRWRHRIVVSLLFYVIFSWALMEIFYFGVWCQPFDNYFAVPTPNPKQCAAAWNHLIMNAVFNLSSDVMLLGITISIVFEKNISGKLRIGLTSLCCLGGFVIACAVANKTYSWRDPFGSQWTHWYIRESSTAILVSNLPYAWHSMWRLFKDGKTYDAEGALESPSRRSSIWFTTNEKHKQDNWRLSRLSSSAESSLQKYVQPEYSEFEMAARALTGPTSVEYGFIIDDISRASKNSHQSKQAALRALDQYRFDDRTRKFPSLASTASLGFDFPSTTGAQEPMPPPRTYARPTPRIAPAILPAYTRAGHAVLGWSSPAEWDTSARIHLNDIGKLTGQGAKKG